MAVHLSFVNPADTAVIAALARWAEPWRHQYSTSVVISTGVLFAHVASLVCAGGLSFAADRQSLLPGARAGVESEQEVFARLANRRLAIRALAAVVFSGSLLFLSDVSTFTHLVTFWLKMGLVVLLITNSLLAQRYDYQTRSAGSVNGRRNRGPRSRYRVHARVSLVLWFLALLSGTALTAA